MISAERLASLPGRALAEDCEVHIEDSALPPPAITYLVRERLWRLEREYVYVGPDWHLHIAAGFRFDLSSIPRAAWGVVAPFELSIAAPLVHDALYDSAGRAGAWLVAHPARAWSRREADRLFRRMMEEEGVSAWRRGLAYTAVRLFGGSAWRGR